MAHLAEKVSEALFGKGEQGEVMDACHRVLTRNEGPPTLTSNFGQPFGDMKHCLNVGGFVATSDVALMEKQQMFNRSKIPERAVHPCGAGAFGYFEVTKDMTKYCKARFLDTVGKRTPVFVRFSTVTPGREFPDSARNPRGFAVKFYTEDGNYDLVGLNFPIFFVRDPVMGPDLIKSQRRNPANFLLDYDALFDFLTQNPESLHCATMFFSDRGTPFGFRHMHGYGCHTFKWVNSQMQAVYVKYHFVCESGVRNMTWEEAKMMSGEDPDFAKRDLWKHFEEGKEATWKVCVQMMPIEDALTCKWDPFDVTKVWPHSTYPLVEFGRLVLNRNPENYHRDVEQAAFSPGSLIRGIEPSPDPLLQFRMFFYRDAQYHRLGVNLHQVPVNCPYRVSGLHPVGQDGAIRCDRNAVGEPIYYPNGVQGAPTDDPRNNWQPVKVQGVLDRQSVFRHQGKIEEEVEQARNLLMKVMTPQDRERLYFNIAEMLKFCREDVKQRTLKAFAMVHPEYASGITKNLATRSSPATI